MITDMQTDADLIAWFTGRLPADWTTTPPQLSIDDEEIVVRITIPAPDLGDEAPQSAIAEAVAGRTSAWREETRETRIAIAREAEQRFGRKVSWGLIIGEYSSLFTHLATPVMTRLRQPERQVLDTLVEAGVARSRSDALRWCVKLVATHSDDWLSGLRAALDQVRTIREQGPAS
jgi:hypothetical protein